MHWEEILEYSLFCVDEEESGEGGRRGKGGLRVVMLTNLVCINRVCKLL